MKCCLYCLGDLSERGCSEEHVLPAALGWDQTISCVCKPCNDRFGYSIDSALVSPFDPYRVHFGITDRDGKPIRGTAKVVSGRLSGKKVRFNQSGPELPPIVGVGNDKEVSFHSFGDFNKGELEEKLSTRKGLGKLQKVSEGREEAVFETTHGMEFLSDLEGIRGAVKVCLNYLALKLECSEDLLLGKTFGPVRNFIRGVSKRSRDDFSLPVPTTDCEIPTHRLLLALDGEGAVAHGVVSLFGFISLYVVLSEDYFGDSDVFSTLVDPCTRQHHEEDNPRDVLEKLSMMRKIHVGLIGAKEKLNQHKIRIFTEAVKHVNKHFEGAGINFTIAHPDIE